MTSAQQTLIYSTTPLCAMECSKPSFILRHPNSTASDIIAHGLAEQSLIDWSKQFCRPDGVFIDAGSHVGMYALSLAPYCQQVHAFECQRQTYYQLCGGVALNAYWNVYPHNVALGDTTTDKVPLYVVSLDGGGTTLTKPWKPLEETFTSVRTLDSFELDNVCFLKLDVEGAEEKTLRGAVKTLERSRYPPFIFESWTEPQYDVQRQSLHDFITYTLGYKIQPINGFPHMMYASR
jgi:FkbM family methyltransferase